MSKESDERAIEIAKLMIQKFEPGHESRIGSLEAMSTLVIDEIAKMRSLRLAGATIIAQGLDSTQLMADTAAKLSFNIFDKLVELA